MGCDNKINGRTPDEIKKGLEVCREQAECKQCGYFHSHPVGENCVEILLADALAYIQQLEYELYQIKRARDAAVNDIEYAAPCFACIRFERNGGDCIGAHVCVDDVLQEALGERYADYYFEWRGVQEVE